MKYEVVPLSEVPKSDLTIADGKQQSQPDNKVEKYDPTDPEARDEGPRLLAIKPQGHPSTDGYVGYYLALADLALATGSPAKKKRHH